MNTLSNGPEMSLMKLIGARWGVAIADACKTSSVSEDLLAALVANESSGNPTARRFEIAHFGEILAVMAGQRSAFNPPGISRPLGKEDFQPFLYPAGGLPLVDSLRRAVQLASSYGLTQIMGWHYIEFDRAAWLIGDPSPDHQLSMTITLLAYFANRNQLDFATEQRELIACWNCGLPDCSKTFDPNYCDKGMGRMGLYAQLRKTFPAPAPGPPEGVSA